jgi:probable rRNA maturation factor
MIEFSLEDVNVPGLDSEHFALWLEQVVIEEGFELGDINLVFCSDEALLKMNIDFLQHDYYTDIITFDYCEENIVSGVLHLCGYKDKSDEDEKQMRAKEDFYLEKYVPRET